MKNACIVLKKKLNVTLDKGANAVFEELYLGGYAFDEIRFLPQMEEERIKEGLEQLKKEYDNVFLLSEKTALPLVRRYVEQVFSNATIFADFANAGIYTDKKTSMFVFSLDETETGVGYVKNACIPFMQKKYGLRFDKIVLRSIGANVNRLSVLLAESMQMARNSISFNHERKYDEDVIEIVYDSNTPKMLVDDILRRLVEGLGDTLYALENVSLENQLISVLKVRGKKISVAESFTGGGLAKRIVSVPGASEVYFEGVNTYNEKSKMKRLGVSPYTLGTLGAVSEKTAYEMALGLLNTGDCDVAIATTGLAGPKSDKNMHPVGYCCIAVGTRERISVYQYKFDGNREEITEKAINYALFLAYKHLKNI